MKITRALVVLVSAILWGCVSIPREAPELSVTLGQRIAAIGDANITLLHRYFDLKRSGVDRFIQDVWVPRFAQKVFTNSNVEREWQEIVASRDTQRRLEFILNAAPALQREINRKRVDLIRPLGACAVGRFSSGRMIRGRGNFVLTTAVPDIGTGNRHPALQGGVNRSPAGSMAVPGRRHRTAIPVIRPPEALASA